MKFLGEYNWYVKIPQCGYMERGLKYILFYVQKHIAPLAICYNPQLVLWQAARSARISETRLFHIWLMSLQLSWGGTRQIQMWVRSRNCSCLVTWFCYRLIAKPGNKTAAVSWPDPYEYDSIGYPRDLMNIFCLLAVVWRRGAKPRVRTCT